MSASQAQWWQRRTAALHRRIWQNSGVEEGNPRRWFFAFLRVCAISYTVFMETAAASRAAALSFSSLLGLGPLVGITVLIAGFVLGSREPKLVADKLHEALVLAAPQIATYEQMAATGPNGQPGTINNELVNMLNGFISGAQSLSGTVGSISVLSLVVVVLLLFKAIEDVFNDIWGVRDGRPIMTRVVYYWTILTLGAVLFFAALTLLGASTFIGVWRERVPFAGEVVDLLDWALPAISFALLVGLLTLCYRVIPNTRVYWRAALAGAVVVAALLLLNKSLAVFYLNRILVTSRLYGSVALPLVIMFGFYFFWLYILIGGIISYAVQNYHFRSSQAAWGGLSESMREKLSLIVFLTICRRFQACLPPVTASHLGSMIKVPTQILNASLGRLVALGLLSPLPPTEHGSSTDYLYQPARPLNSLTLADFKSLFERHGEDPTAEAIDTLDPLVGRYQERLKSLTTADADLLQKPLDVLLGEVPFDETHPPFTRLAAK